MTNIFAPSPRINPSLLNSKAGEAMEFANPVMGTNVPAPANFAILPNKLNPVSKQLRKISEIEESDEAVSLSTPKETYRSQNAWPNMQINPPMTKATGSVFHSLVFELARLFNSSYSRFVSFTYFPLFHDKNRIDKRILLFEKFFMLFYFFNPLHFYS